MTLAKPSMPRFRAGRIGDQLVIRIPSREHIGQVIVMVPWLLGWAFFEVAAFGLVLFGLPLIGIMAILSTPCGVANLLWVIPFWLFMVIWLRGWTHGGKHAIRLWLWHLFGVETITLGRDRLTVDLYIPWFQRSREYQTAEVSRLRVWPDRASEQGGTSMLDLSGEGRGSLAFETGVKTEWFGVDLDRSEAIAIRNLMIAHNPALTEDQGTNSAQTESGNYTSSDPNNLSTVEQLEKTNTTLSTYHDGRKPVKALTREVFPKEMRVIRFVPGKLLEIAFDSSRGEKARMAAFSVAHWTLFPGLAGGFLGQLVGAGGATIGGIVGAALGLANWFRLSRRGPYIRINFQSGSYAVISVVGAARWGRLPEARIETVFQEHQWIATVRIAEYVVAKNTSEKSHLDAEQPFDDFVRALNWQMGNRESLTEGDWIKRSTSRAV